MPLHAPLKPVGQMMLLTVSDPVPLLVIVSVVVAVAPRTTLPKAKVPPRPMIRVSGTKKGTPFRIVLLPQSASYRLPALSTATPAGK